MRRLYTVELDDEDKELVARLLVATAGITRLQDQVAILAAERKVVVDRLCDKGWSYAEIGNAADLSRSRISQIRTGAK